jgi:8-oxo-dGTP pyrophosphatase MutT (NUDIX family)/predicted Fe-S protein YdhL (DUF1289 family)
MTHEPAPEPIASPCTGVCRLGADGHCVGCLRSRDEIACWRSMAADQRRRIMEEVLPRRARTAWMASAHPVDEPRLRRAVRPLGAAPEPPGWNAADLDHGSDAPEPRCPAAVLVPIVRRDEGLHVLFTRRTDHLRNHAGQVSFPGGRIEAGDADAIAAALRETREETGIEAASIEPFGYLDSLATVSGYCVVPVVAFVEATHRAAPDGIEVAEVFEVPLAHVLAPGTLRPGTVQWQGRPRPIVEFDWQGHRVWGATAAILLDLARCLERYA